MTDGPRALLTDRERDALRGDVDDMTDDTKNSLLRRVRRKLEEELPTDTQIIRESSEEEFGELLHEAVCAEELDDRVSRLEEKVERLTDGDGDMTDIE